MICLSAEKVDGITFTWVPERLGDELKGDAGHDECCWAEPELTHPVFSEDRTTPPVLSLI